MKRMSAFTQENIKKGNRMMSIIFTIKPDGQTARSEILEKAFESIIFG